MGFISGSLRYYVPGVSEGDWGGGGVVRFENVQNVRGAEVLRPSIRILFKFVKPYYKANPCFLLIAEKNACGSLPATNYRIISKKQV